MHDFICYKRLFIYLFIYLVSYFIFNRRSLLFSIFFLVTRPLGSTPRADSSYDDTFSDSAEEEPCEVRKKLFLTAYKTACVEGVKRGREKGNLGARELVWRESSCGAWSRALIPFPFPFERLPHRLLVKLLAELRPRLYGENLSRTEGSLPYPSHPGRVNFSYISLQNVANSLHDK